MGLNIGALGTIAGTAAPGIKQGIDNYQDFKSDKASDAQANGNPLLAGAIPTSNLAASNHPVWNFINSLGGGSAAPAAPAQPVLPPPQFPAAQMGAPISQGIPTDPMQQLAGGGIVTGNFGTPTMRPQFVQGPMQGIRPASTEGQILTMADVGFVPAGGISPSPMNGPLSSFVQGIESGQTIGHNFQEQWQGNQARQAANLMARHAVSADVNNPDAGNGSPAQTSFLDDAKNAVEKFFGHAHAATLDDAHKPNGATPAVGIPDPGTITASTGGPAPSPLGASPLGGATPPNLPGSPNAPVPTAGDASGASAAPHLMSPSDRLVGPTDAPLQHNAQGDLINLSDADKANATQFKPVSLGGGQSAALPSSTLAQLQAREAANPGSVSGNTPPAGTLASAPGTPPSGPVSPVQAAATAKVVQQVGADASSQAGQPSQSAAASNVPHSLTPAWWRESNRLMQDAVGKAALAGEDPYKVYQSLDAMRTAHFQGQVLKQTQAASAALENGDIPAVTQALKNINYYLPDGQDIHIKTATAADAKADPSVQVGDLMHSNPYQGMYGHEKDPAYIKVDSMYLRDLALGAMDPTKMKEAQMSRFKASSEAEKAHLEGVGAYKAGAGREMVGASLYDKQQLNRQNNDLHRQMMGAQIGDIESQAAERDRMPAGGKGPNSSGAPKISMAQLRDAQNDGIQYADQMAQGMHNTLPSYHDDPTGAVDANGKPVQVLDINPNAGKNILDPTHMHPLWQGITDTQRAEINDYSGSINAANLGRPGMNKAAAAELAARIVHYNHESNPKDAAFNPAKITHINPETGKPEKNVIYNEKEGYAHVWVGNTYKNCWLFPNASDAPAQGIPTRSAEPGASESAEDAAQGAAVMGPA